MDERPAGLPGRLAAGALAGLAGSQGVQIGDGNQQVNVFAPAAPTALSQLPPLTAGFTGRDADLGVLVGLLDPARAGGLVVVSAVGGLAGIGKTILAVRAGHAARARGWFGGGVLFIDLHGYDDHPVRPAQALDALLRALGVPAEHIPPGAAERAGLYRSALTRAAGPVLVVADNASSEAQVRPLLPGTGPHAVLVTSRHTLAGLGARLVDLDVLAADASVALLDAAVRAARPADDRVTADPAAAALLTRACAGLPLALQVTAAILVADPSLSAGELAGELAGEEGRLAYDDGTLPGGLSVAAAFGASCRRLGAGAARLFRLLAVAPGPDVSAAAAAALAGLPVPEARRLLGDLGRAHLAGPAPGAAGRWRMHDLVRLYSRQLGDAQAAADGRAEGVARLLEWYLSMAGAADDRLRGLPGAAGFAGQAGALAWMDAERPALTAAVALAAEAGYDQAAMRLPLRLAEYLLWRRRFDDRLAVISTGLAAARRLGDRHGEAATLTTLGTALHVARRFEEAITAHQDAAAIFRETGDRHGEGRALNNLGLALRTVRRFEEAITACQDAAAIRRETGDRNGEGVALTSLGLTLADVRRFEEAITAYRTDMSICREAGDRHGQGAALDRLGSALRGARRFEEAITAHQDAAAIFREASNQHGEDAALQNLAAARAARDAEAAAS